MNKLFHDNGWQFRLLRTIIQGVIGVLIANIDVFASAIQIDPMWKPIIAATVMAILSPIMAELGNKSNEE